MIGNNLKLSNFILLLTVILYACFNSANAQYFSRIEADFSIKNKAASGHAALTMGRVYYDLNLKNLVYVNTFPESDVWLALDTSLIQVKDGQVMQQLRFPGMTEFTIFHLALSQQLANYGLDQQHFELQTVEKDQGLVISTWRPVAAMQGFFSKIMVSNKDKRLDGLLFFDAEDKIISKQFFRKYQNVAGLEFPGEIIQIDYTAQGENYQITSFRNIKLNNFTDETYYNYKLPVD